MGDINSKVELYHGTITPFNMIDPSKGWPYKDFGQGFYAGEDYNQAKGLTENRKAGQLKMFAEGLIPNPQGLSIEAYEAQLVIYVYTYEFNRKAAHDLQARGLLQMNIFKGATLEWFDFVIHNRETEPTVHGYDIVIGPTADDATSLVVSRYFAGRYGEVGYEQTKLKALKDFKAEKFGVQYYFRNSLAVSTLRRVNEEVIV